MKKGKQVNYDFIFELYGIPKHSQKRKDIRNVLRQNFLYKYFEENKKSSWEELTKEQQDYFINYYIADYMIKKSKEIKERTVFNEERLKQHGKIVQTLSDTRKRYDIESKFGIDFYDSADEDGSYRKFCNAFRSYNRLNHERIAIPEKEEWIKNHTCINEYISRIEHELHTELYRDFVLAKRQEETQPAKPKPPKNIYDIESYVTIPRDRIYEVALQTIWKFIQSKYPDAGELDFEGIEDTLKFMEVLKYSEPYHQPLAYDTTKMTEEERILYAKKIMKCEEAKKRLSELDFIKKK